MDLMDGLISPGQGCLECGRYYGQHWQGCRTGDAEAQRRKEVSDEDAISKRDLLRRIEALERRLK